MEITVKGEPKEIAALVVGLKERQASELDEVWEHFRRKVKRNLPKAADSEQFTLTLSLDNSYEDDLEKRREDEAHSAARRRAFEQFLEHSRKQHQAPLQWRRQWYSVLRM